MKEYQSEITNEIIKGVTIGIALIIVFVIAILVMRLILEKNTVSSTKKKLIYIAITIVFVIIITFSIFKTVNCVHYYTSLKETSGTISKMQYYREKGKSSYSKASVVEVINKHGDKNKYVLYGEIMPYIPKGTKIKIVYSESNGSPIKGTIKTYVTK